MAGREPETRLSETEASAGEKLGVMRYVLGISMILVVVIFLFIVWRPFG